MLKRTVDVGFKWGFKPRFWLSLTRSNELPSPNSLAPPTQRALSQRLLWEVNKGINILSWHLLPDSLGYRKHSHTPNKSPCSQLPCEGSRTALTPRRHIRAIIHTWEVSERNTYRARGEKRRTGRVGALWAVHTCAQTEGVSFARLSLEKFQHIPLTQSPRQEPAFDLYVFNISAEILKP